jgi:pimeloyl-ACP methyl ester carboxylesterase
MNEQSWQTETVALPTGGIQLARAGSGPPLVVLHQDIGNPGRLPVYDALAQRFAVVIPDLPGYGGSERLEWARHPRDLAAVLNFLLDRLGLDGVTLLGLGFGGWLAAEMAVMHQRRLARLVLVGATGIRPENGYILDQMLISHAEYVQAGFHDAAPYERVFGAEPSADQQKVWDLNREVIARITWKPYMFSLELPHLLRCLEVPATVVWGRHDAVVPLECGEAYARAIPGATLEIVEDAGHFVEMERPEALVRLCLEPAVR